MAGTPPAKILETIAQVETIQQKLEILTEAIERLTRRVEAIERASPDGPRARGSG